MEAEKIKVLIVDDNSKFLKVLQQNLESRDCIVQCASNRQIALTLLMNEIFHIAFIDCVLNEGQGTDLVQDIRKYLGHSVDIVMMSGIVQEKSISSYVDLDIHGFLSKPIADKDIEQTLGNIKDKYLYGGKQNILVKLFKQNSSSVQLLKLLVSLDEIKSYEFFFYLNKALLLKESLNIDVKLHNKKYRITCNKGVITNYECEDSNIFLQNLLSKNFITRQEMDHLKGRNQEECIDILLRKCILSSGQISDVKYDMLLKLLESIAPEVKLSVKFNLTPPKKDAFLLLNQGEYADLVFLFLKQKFNDQLFFLFDEEIMKKYLIFEKNVSDYLAETEEFIADLKSGMKLKGIYDKYIDNKNYFCSYLIYILLKGDVYLSESSHQVKYYYLYERYNNLFKIVEKNSKPENVFKCFDASLDTTSISPKEIKSIYLRFIQNNHPDKIPIELPAELFNLINKLLSKLKNFYDAYSIPSLRKDRENKKKQEILEKEILLTEQKKICERHLEEGKCKEAFSLIKSVSQAVLDEDMDWQLFYIWVYFENQRTDLKINVNKNTAHKYIKNVTSKARDLLKNKFYCYILGLHYESNRHYEKARDFFEKSKMLDPSFQPSYSSSKRCSLNLIKSKKEQPLLFKWKSFSLGDLVKKNKKAG